MAGHFGVNPDFLIIGASRSGTTSLSRYLGQNARIYMAPGETHFFDFNYSRPIEWYRRRFRRGMVNGEHSPFYMACAGAAKRAFEALPDARIIALCREPVARAFSHYSLNRQRGEESAPFVMALKMEKERIGKYIARGMGAHAEVRRYSYAYRGMYADRLAEWLQYYPREQVAAVKSEDLFDETVETVADLCRWLGVEPHEFAHKKRFQGQAYKGALDPKDREQAAEFFAEANERLALEWGIAW